MFIQKVTSILFSIIVFEEMNFRMWKPVSSIMYRGKKLKIPFFVWGGKTHIWDSLLSSRTRFQLLPWKSCNLSTHTYLLLTWIIWISIFSCNGPIMHMEHYNLIHIKNIINKPFSLLADFNCLANQLQLEWL